MIREEMTIEEKQQIAKDHGPELIQIITQKILPELHGLIELLDNVSPSKQLQLALMDIESINMHLADLQANGPAQRLEEIPLEKSEIHDEFVPEGWGAREEVDFETRSRTDLKKVDSVKYAELPPIVNFEDLKGRTIVHIEGMSEGNGEVILTLEDGTRVRFYHEQNCCEDVTLTDVNGDVSDLIGSPITFAQVSTGSPLGADGYGFTEWTFYKLATEKGFVDLRWTGSSNGYYATNVSMEVLAPTVEDHQLEYPEKGME